MIRNFIFLSILAILLPWTIYARVTPNDIYQEKVAVFEKSLTKILNTTNRNKVEKADQMLYDVNQKECALLDQSVAKLSAIMEELKARTNITKTVVAYGQGDTPIDSAAYLVNYAAEAVAYQKIQDYTPTLSGSDASGVSLATTITYQINRMQGDLSVLRGKILRAKTGVAGAIQYAKQ